VHSDNKEKFIMEMIDVLKKLAELESKSPEVAKALDNARRMSGQPVGESVQITVSGSDAVLSQILKLAGLIGAETTEAVDEGDPEHRPHVNSPDETVLDFDTAIPAGSDLHMAKGTYPKVAGGDNPMAAPRPLSLRSRAGI
jgi:hypothetical protein